MIPRWKQFFTAQNGEKLTVLKKILKLDEKVDSYDTKIDNAVAGIETATEAANGAVLTANAAITLAETAQTTATEAKSNVENAQNTAVQANETADSALEGLTTTNEVIQYIVNTVSTVFYNARRALNGKWKIRTVLTNLPTAVSDWIGVETTVKQPQGNELTDVECSAIRASPTTSGARLVFYDTESAEPVISFKYASVGDLSSFSVYSWYGGIETLVTDESVIEQMRVIKINTPSQPAVTVDYSDLFPLIATIIKNADRVED